MVIDNTQLKGSFMKSPFASVGVAAVLAAGLILAPGLSPAQADTATSNDTAPVSSVQTENVATTYGMWFIPCNVFGFRMC
ncbi:hypothetical protein CVS28_07760 [Arthrobacter glacialis]|uniref:Uncharacterized protein n=2 Tax=Arthrobacter glacialis TaxID=1664 RepID=A0A2S3ZX80_ARTGL|nr:hypothetical protein CVS28_07760 [Arthrobacter glacialis]POH73875.1 hypothetical protein CVS27_08130 [Arthrobacter glacialis]